MSKKPIVKTKRKMSSTYGESKMIVRAEFRVHVMLEANSIDEAAALLSSTDINYVIAEMNDGEWLGTHEFMGVTRVLPWDVETLCMSMGNDGTFFDDVDKE